MQTDAWSGFQLHPWSRPICHDEECHKRLHLHRGKTSICGMLRVAKQSYDPYLPQTNNAEQFPMPTVLLSLFCFSSAIAASNPQSIDHSVADCRQLCLQSQHPLLFRQLYCNVSEPPIQKLLPPPTWVARMVILHENNLFLFGSRLFTCTGYIRPLMVLCVPA